MKAQSNIQDVDILYREKHTFVDKKIYFIAVDGNNTGAVSRVVIYVDNGKALYWANGSGWSVQSWDMQAEHNSFRKRNWLQRLLRLR